MDIDKRLVKQVDKLQCKIERRIEKIQKYIIKLNNDKNARIEMVKNEGGDMIKLKINTITKKFNAKIEKYQNKLNDLKKILEKLRLQ